MPKRIIKVNLRNVLQSKGYDQKRLADETGLTERTISELVNGKMKRYPKDAIERIAEVLNIIDINDILTLVEEETKA
ncbi:helix-turn-helix domain-containing protein [Psychrobacillus sp. FSL K6-1415]|uniref:helix-turn-helix domain-containing protein n=1 Tax=Psychrobacillus sp. FSL K6-1415 TaxID=2921544 RepID=UPI0030F62C97